MEIKRISTNYFAWFHNTKIHFHIIHKIIFFMFNQHNCEHSLVTTKKMKQGHLLIK